MFTTKSFFHAELNNFHGGRSGINSMKVGGGGGGPGRGLSGDLPQMRRTESSLVPLVGF